MQISEIPLKNLNEEIEFMMLGLEAFFDTDNDKNMDWEDFFSLN